jgi:ABC-2 type transport system permease protein
MTMLRETGVLFSYYVKLSLRSPLWLGVALFQPVCYLFLYGPLLTSLSAHAGQSANETIQLFTPGLLVMVAFFASMFVGFSMIDDLKSGVVERLSVTPVSRLALLLGRSLRDALTLLIQSLILIVLSLTLHVHLAFLGTLLTLLAMMLVALFMSPLSYALALTLKTEDAVGSTINLVAQPMLLLSGVLIPLTFAPHWLQTLSALNPLKYIVDACRMLFMGNIFNATVFHGVIVLLLLVALSLGWGVRTYQRAI